jgi:hypothetical protein
MLTHLWKAVQGSEQRGALPLALALSLGRLGRVTLIVQLKISTRLKGALDLRGALGFDSRRHGVQPGRALHIPSRMAFSAGELEFVKGGVAVDVRLDGRDCSTFR